LIINPINLIFLMSHIFDTTNYITYIEMCQAQPEIKPKDQQNWHFYIVAGYY